MAYRLSRSESVHQGALRIAQEELGAGIEQLRGEGDPHERVHAARKAIKRTRALLRLIRAGLGSRFGRENRRLRDAARRLSGARDAAVAAAVFEKLVDEPSPGLLAVRDALIAARDAASADAAGEDPLAAAAAELEVAAQQRSAWPVLSHGWTVLESGLRDSYAGGRAAMREAFADPSAHAFHEWRKRVKDLWYHSLLLQGVWKTVMAAWSEALEDLSDVLGEDHDLEVLRLAVDQLEGVDPAARRELHALADDRSSELRTAAWTLGQRLYAERPRRFLARLRAYWGAWRGDERRASEARRVSDLRSGRPEAPPSEVVLAPEPAVDADGCPPGPDPKDRGPGGEESVG